MRSVNNTFHLITDGAIKYDGGAFFGQLPKMVWEKYAKPDRWNRINLGLNSLVIKTDKGNVLINTGVGTKDAPNIKDRYGLARSKLLNGLKEVDLLAKDIDFVILTQLQFDHSGGCTKIDRSGKPIPVFPKAKYVIQKSCWDYSINPGARNKHYYNPQDFLCLDEARQLMIVEGEKQILPGVSVKETGGYCIGHQIVQIESGGDKVVFSGNLIPTSFNVELNCISSYDQFPEETLVQKREIIDKAVKEGWLLVFAYGSNHKAGYVEKRDGHISFKPVKI